MNMTSLPRPKTSPSAPVREVAMAILGCVPLGSMLQLVAGGIWKDPAFENLRKFTVTIAEEVHRLQQRDSSFDLEEVLSRDETQPLLTRAFDAAARSFGERKLEALRNATVQGVFERQYSFDMSAMVFTLLDRITEGHLVILQAIFNAEAQRRPALTDHEVALVGFEPQRLPKSPEGQKAVHASINQTMSLNELILDDLKNMGLVEVKGDRPTGIVAPSATGPTNIQFRNRLSKKGRLLYEHIFLI
ncbi:hypothetical protein ELH42_16875 [Rhizobium ruizarguesonis]|uniref:hypothetical protein n=1 Tax=Rhizobium ruizarguesonis TaxID=2081791 RepID=UPI0010304DC6|nr:hypothetical protein [Rhizobium ruizarguesonis]TBB67729.1 hypothetical protein ELH42_16875 [Rhizobium ruizarguesonis]